MQPEVTNSPLGSPPAVNRETPQALMATYADVNSTQE